MIIYFLQGEYIISLNDAIVGTSCNSPLHCSFGKALADLTDPVVVVEKTVLRMPSMGMAVVCCFFCYYIYNIQYPPSLRKFFHLFREHF